MATWHAALSPLLVHVHRLLALPGLVSLRGWAPGRVTDDLPSTSSLPRPQTFFANERTFLSWLNMAVTIGSISAALLGFSGSSKADPGVSVAWLTSAAAFPPTQPHPPTAHPTRTPTQLSACRMQLGCAARGVLGAAWVGAHRAST